MGSTFEGPGADHFIRKSERPWAKDRTDVKKCVVAGAGVFGAWTAYSLTQAGHEVTLLDCYGPGNTRASSGGESRIIRASYGADEIYTRMAVRSLALWEAFFARTGRTPLLRRTGVLWLADPGNEHAEQSRQTLKAAGVRFEELTAAELGARFPQFQVEATAIFEPEGGALMARACVEAVVDQFVREGGIYRKAQARQPVGSGRLSAIDTADGGALAADEFIFACGAWLPKLMPDLLGGRIFPTRQEVFFFGIPAGERRFDAPEMPVWIDFNNGRGMYGFPNLEERGFKVAFDTHGPGFDPDTGTRLPTPEKTEAARRYVAERFPALAGSPIIESRVCQYENTWNGDFVIDRHPDFENVWIAGGGSGHGFKHGPAIGEYLTARVNGSESPAVEPRFSLASKSGEQQRAVY